MWSEKLIGPWISSFIFIGFALTSEGAWLRCYKGSIRDYIATPLSQPQRILSSCVDPGLPTVVYTFGYRGRSGGPATTAVLNAYIAKRKRNVLLLDWEEEAKSSYFGIPLGYVLNAVPNAAKIGQMLGGTLVELASSLNMTDMHLVGHSLGAQLMGYAGRSARSKGFIVPRITGLDPARALFEGSLAIKPGLDRTCARFVDIVHSDPGGYGTARASGSVDIWPNYAGQASTQPGCPLGDFPMFSPEDLCSHDRSWRYFTEAIGAPTALPATRAANYEEWMDTPYGSDNSSEMIYLGDLTNTRARGNFFLSTNTSPPFGKGQEGLIPDSNQIRKRRSNTLTRLLKYLR